jgi:hypothetical protein
MNIETMKILIITAMLLLVSPVYGTPADNVWAWSMEW